MEWKKLGRILAPQRQGNWWVSHSAVPTGLPLEDDTWRIYFTGRDAANRSHTSFFDLDLQDPLRPFNLSPEPLLRPGGLATFDEAGAMASWIVEKNSKLYLYYIGWNLAVSVPFRNSIGLAVSNDGGETFEKHGGPILDRSRHDPCFCANPCVLVDNGIWRMWYLSCVSWEMVDGKPVHRYHIKYAESSDGLVWRPTGVVCIDFKDETEIAISRPCVLKENNKYKMWFSYRGSRYRIGYAESADGLAWDRKDNQVGIDVSPSGWDADMVEYPFVFTHGPQRYMLYNGNGYGKTGIGLAIEAASR